jgi:hypothetical protein
MRRPATPLRPTLPLHLPWLRLTRHRFLLHRRSQPTYADASAADGRHRRTHAGTCSRCASVPFCQPQRSTARRRFCVAGQGACVADDPTDSDSHISRRVLVALRACCIRCPKPDIHTSALWPRKHACFCSALLRLCTLRALRPSVRVLLPPMRIEARAFLTPFAVPHPTSFRRPTRWGAGLRAAAGFTFFGCLRHTSKEHAHTHARSDGTALCTCVSRQSADNAPHCSLAGAAAGCSARARARRNKHANKPSQHPFNNTHTRNEQTMLHEQRLTLAGEAALTCGISTNACCCTRGNITATARTPRPSSACCHAARGASRAQARARPGVQRTPLSPEALASVCAPR